MNSRFVDRTLRSVVNLLQGALFAEEIAARRGLLQSLDPRVRTMVVVLFLGLVLFAKTLPLLGVLYGMSLFLAVLSRIDPLFFLARTWFFIPLFSLMVAFPAVFQVVTPGEVVMGSGFLSVTRQGLMGAAFLVSRTACSVSFAVLLSLTTRHFDLLKVLRWFGIPPLFVMVTGMTYRYIYLLLELTERVHQAVKSRVGNATGAAHGRRLVAWNMAVLWLRSHQLSEQVYGAMRSRGYRGEPVLLHRFQTKPWDWCFLVLTVGMAAFLIYASTRGWL